MRMGRLLEALFLSEGAGAYLVWGLIRERERVQYFRGIYLVL